MMIDMFNHDDHDDYENIIEYYKSNFKDSNGNIRSIFRYICTHPHQDHICGIKKIFEDSGININNFWDIDHEFEPEEFQDDEHKEDWNKYKEIRKEDSEYTVIRTKREDKPSKYWDDEEDRIEVLSPSEKLIEKAHNKEDGTKRKAHEVDLNNMPYVLLMRVNKLKVVFASDAEDKCWEDILDNCSVKLGNIDLLKAAHHGRLSGFQEKAVKKMNPKYIVFSMSNETDDEHGAEEDYKNSVLEAEIIRTNDGTVVAKLGFDGKIEIE